MASPTAEFEKLGSFYLGRVYDLAAKRRGDDLLLYDSKDLVTHAVCVGMTGSGKTGLCLGLIEEAAIDGIPAILIDPKGDLSNLLLTFPDLKPEDFAPWVNEDDARKSGQTVAEFAAAQAAMWAKGLGEWGQDGARIKRLKEAADFSVYTPGSAAGLKVSVLKSFDAPPREVVEDGELFRERVGGTATSLLGLMGIWDDGAQNREHILLSGILGAAWSQGQSLDVPGLIAQIRQPPFTKLGVMELESVYPSKERFELAMALNNLVASPGFSAWMEGEPLDIQAMLFTKEGKPRVTIFSIAHLDDSQRMFFVSLLLNQFLGWVRTQSGTTSLRALLYMDEIAWYFPPVANPPSKRPLLTLLKEARAFGVGCVLATQNPVDIDYKGLANAGTWFIGRLQTERDKARVLDGLEGAAARASAAVDRAAADKALSSLGSRVFLMNNVHEDRPEVFESRWCLSYLRGPLMRPQIKRLMDPKRSGNGAAAAAPAGAAAGERARPVLPAEIPQYFIPSRSVGAPVYEPWLLGLGKVYYADAKAGIDEKRDAAFMTPLVAGVVAADWGVAEESDLTEADLEREPAAGATFAPLPADASKAKSFEAWKKGFADALFRKHSLEMLTSKEFGVSSKPGESERDFKARLAQVAREERDGVSEKLRQKYGSKIAAIQDRIRRAEQAVEVQKEQASAAATSTWLSVGAAVLGAFMGRKMVSATSISKAGAAARGFSKQSKESSDVARAEENVGAMRQQMADLEAEFQAEVDAAVGRVNAAAEELERVSLKPKKTNITVKAVVLVWKPRE